MAGANTSQLHLAGARLGPLAVAAMKKQRFTAADRAKRVKEWERSGLSGVEFGRRAGVSPGVL